MIDAVDCAYPHPGQYPTQIVCGYVSGHTAHIWTDQEIDEVGQEGKTFCAIATARNTPPTPPLNATDGHNDARDMSGRLRARAYPFHFPVFYDQEPGIVDAGPAGADAAMAAWQADMKAAGWIHGFDYRVLRQGGDWVADPTGIRPLTIPQGKIGEQWGGNGTFDFDVFADNILGGDVTSPANGWTPQDFQKLFTELADFVFLNPDVVDSTGKVNPIQTAFGAAFGRMRDRSYALLTNTDQPGGTNALKAAIARIPTSVTLTSANLQAIATDVVTALEAQGIKVDPSTILNAMSARLAS